MAGEKTEKATPKKRQDSRKQGQVGRSADLQGAVVLLTGLLALSAFAPGMYRAVTEATRHALALVATPEVVERGANALSASRPAMRTTAPLRSAERPT